MVLYVVKMTTSKEKIKRIIQEVIQQEQEFKAREQELKNIDIELSNRLKRTLAYADTEKNKIVLNKGYYKQARLKDLKRTLKHELLHFLNYNHDNKFKEIALKMRIVEPFKYIYSCSCGMRYKSKKYLPILICGRGYKRNRKGEGFKRSF